MERDVQPFLISAIENAYDAVIVYEYVPGPAPFRIRYVNPMFEQQTGYARAEAIGSYPEIMYGPKTDRAAVERVAQSLLLKLPVELETLRYRKDGTTFWAEINMRPLCDDADTLLGVVAIQRDVSERVRAQGRLELLSSAMDQATDAIAVFEWRDASAHWRLTYVNEMFLRLTGYRRDEVIGRPSDFLVGEQTDRQALNGLRAALLAGETMHGEFVFYRSDGSQFWAEVNARPFQNAEGRIGNAIVLYRDVTEKRERDLRLSYEATHDALTGAHNRRSFLRTLETALDDARERLMTHGLLLFDLDGFKPINDRYGHEAGDHVLVHLTKTLHAKLRRTDLLARIGGDEFAVLLRGCPADRAEEIAGEVLDAILHARLLWNGHTLRVGASIGVASFDATAEDAADVLRRADRACYEAKRAGRNRIFIAS
jgi:diguanylate cyclase (GGDEF)-like protein/PAS domain S-box-containing protein